MTDSFPIDGMLAVVEIVVFDDVFLPGAHQACRYVALNRAYTVKACTEPVADYRPSNIARISQGAAGDSTAARKLLKSKFVTPDDTLQFTPDCRCVAFEKLTDHARHREAPQEF